MGKWQNIGGFLGLCMATGCVEPTNPCDPGAATAVRATAALAGVVRDQDGTPKAGVTVVLSGHPVPAISDDDGRFSFRELLPQTPFELLALPEAPAIGGSLSVAPLGCQEEVKDLELIVAVPPPSPEVELVEATAPNRALVAFAAVDGARYRVEIRSPFGTWRDATLSSTEDENAPVITDDEAASLCQGFAYVHPTLSDERARCAEVTGTIDDETAMLLEDLGSYEVRVRAEVSLDDVMTRTQRLPPRVLSVASGVPGELSLLPVTLLPVPMDTDVEASAAAIRGVVVNSITTVAEERFVLLNTGNSSPCLMLLGGDDAAAAYTDATHAPTETLAYDHGSASANDELMDDEGVGLAILPTRRWVRVWKEYQDPASGERKSQVEKIFVGAETREETHASRDTPSFDFEILGSLGADKLRGFHFLTRPSGSFTGEDVYDPPDAYLMLLESGFVMLEREEPTRLVDDTYLSDSVAQFGDGLVTSDYAAGALGPSAALFGGPCGALGQGAQGMEGEVGERLTRVCVDLGAILGESLDLRDVDILPATEGITLPVNTHHVFLDAAHDRVLAVRTSALLANEGKLQERLAEVPVGITPSAVSVNRQLRCGAEADATPVALVANEGSLDVSVLQVVGVGPAARVEEVAVVPLPGAPVRFLEDVEGASCSDPFAWVVLDDGRTVPLDLRSDRMGVPSCGSGPCAVKGRDRSLVGAVSRAADGRSRILLGGRGTLGEVGYLRPRAAP
ncbi:MAG: carboxypeptidase-like regulatory domain-containing protein [Myxococcota bacterium]